MPSTCEALVVGAGVAGLSAALAFRSAGIACRVIEASSRSGGRVLRARRSDGALWDCGAQFIAPPAPCVMRLLAHAELDRALVPLSPAHALVDGARMLRVASSDPLSLVREGLVTPREAACAAIEVAPMLASSVAFGLHDYGRAAPWDRAGGDRVLGAIVDPLLDGVFFLDARAESRALSVALLAYFARKRRFCTIAGGYGRLPEALASRLAVEHERPALAVRVGSDGVAHVDTDRETIHTRRCVLALPATAAHAIFHAPNPRERALVETRYAPAVVASFVLRGPRPRAFADLYGVLFSRRERRAIGSLSFGEHGVVVTASSAAAIDLAVVEPAVAIDRMRREIAVRFPELAARLGEASLHTWREAIPRCPVGRATAARAYRRSLDPAWPVRLAGDYTSYPTTESAAWSGAWAAESLVGRGARAIHATVVTRRA